MARRPYKALAVIPTPDGDVIVRRSWAEKQRTYVLIFEGEQDAVRRVLPDWRPRNSRSRRTQLTPTRPLRKAVEITRWYRDMAPSLLAQAAQPVFTTVAEVKPITLLEAMDRAAEGMRSSVRPSSLRTYGMQWRTVLQFLPGSQLVQDLSRQTIQAAINRMADAGYQPRTVQGMVRALHRVIRPLLLDRVLSHDPLQGIELPAVLDRPPRFLTREQRQRVLEVAESRGSDVHLFFGIALYAGLRCGELLTLRGEHIDLRRKLIVVTNDEHFRTKSGRSRTVPICQDLWTILGRYRRRRGWLLWPRQTAKVLGPRFDTRRLVVSIGKEAGVPWLRPHTMRHTFATLGADAGVSLVKLQAWLGHRSLMSTQVYLHALAGWDDDIDKLAS